MKLVTNRIFTGDAQALKMTPRESVQLIVTSPPYNVGKTYDGTVTSDSKPVQDYLAFLRRVWKQCMRVLVPGGRLFINVANTGRKPYLSLDAYITVQLEQLGFLVRGKIIWDKGASATHSAAWGSFASASNPVLRDVHEYLIVASKADYRLGRTHGDRSGIAPDDFVTWTKSVWKMQTVRVKGHPAPFPLELARRAILLYTHENDVVLDPFMGSGSTAIAALETGRRFIGYEMERKYVAIAEARIAKFTDEAQAACGTADKDK